MKSNLRFTFAWIVSLLILASCSSEEITTGLEPVVKESGLKYMEFTASAGADTRTQLTSDNKVEWVAGDEISIFDGTANRKFTTKDSGTNAIFGGEAKEATTYYALYPYQEGATIEGNIIKNVVIPTVQEAKAGSFDGGVNYSVASASTDLQLAFKNVGSLVKFSISNDKAADVRSVKLTSNDGTAILAGTVNITVGATPTVTPVSSQNQVTLKSDAGFEAGEDYFFMVLPGTLSDGFSLTFTDNEGLTWQKTYTAEASMSRSNILKLNAIELGTFTTGLLTNVNLIAAAEASTGRSFNKNDDGTVSLLDPTNMEIVNSVTEIDVTDKNDATIADELSIFCGLKVLRCSGNNITTLDLTANIVLEELYNEGKEVFIVNEYGDEWSTGFEGVLTNLILPQNASAIKKLYVRGNLLTSIDVTGFPNLIELSCSFNSLQGLDVSNNQNLEILLCNDNPLGMLDLTNNTKLINLDVCTCDLSTLNLSKNTELIDIRCAYNNLNELDVTKLSKLTSLHCQDNSLTSIDLSNNTLLDFLSCGSNKLTNLDVSTNTLLSHFSCDSNQLTSLDLTHNPHIGWLSCYSNHLTELDVSIIDNNASIVVGNQSTMDGEPQTLTVYVNAVQYAHEPGGYIYYIDNYNPWNQYNVNYVVKSDATHEGYNETNYGI